MPLLLFTAVHRFQPVLVDINEQDVVRRAVVVLPEVGLPEGDLVQDLLRETVTAVGERLRVRERAEDA
jgi:hypothetical protein